MGNQKLRTAMAVFKDENSQARQTLKAYEKVVLNNSDEKHINPDWLKKFLDLLKPPPLEENKDGDAENANEEDNDLFEYQSLLCLSKSPGIQTSDDKRHAETIHQAMQAGFQTIEKKIEMLK